MDSEPRVARNLKAIRRGIWWFRWGVGRSGRGWGCGDVQAQHAAGQEPGEGLQALLGVHLRWVEPHGHLLEDKEAHSGLRLATGLPSGVVGEIARPPYLLITRWRFEVSHPGSECDPAAPPLTCDRQVLKV